MKRICSFLRFFMLKTIFFSKKAAQNAIFPCCFSFFAVVYNLAHVYSGTIITINDMKNPFAGPSLPGLQLPAIPIRISLTGRFFVTFLLVYKWYNSLFFLFFIQRHKRKMTARREDFEGIIYPTMSEASIRRFYRMHVCLWNQSNAMHGRRAYNCALLRG